NINYKNISYKTIRNLISYTSQNENIFHGTIRDNILMGHEITNERLMDIIDICELNRIINKKIYGLDNYLYGGGSELSGGERQLIFLARSLVLDKQIMILDETLSEVNDAIEDRILKKLFSKYKDRTIIYVSHKNKKNYFKKTIYV
nr:ATP-binding cassette domain-containing protein [Bacilli bacterium]